MKIIYPNYDGGVSIVVASTHWKGTMEELAQKDVPSGKPYKIVEDSVIPSDRTFRDAWENYESINVNFSKAQTITKERLRRERKPLLEEQDILFIRAVENSQDKSEIVTEKQRLRDITLSVDTAVDLDELKGLNVDG
jgi:hypothetical protein